MARRPELGKWLLWKLMHQNEYIRPYLPQTTVLSLDRLLPFVHRFGSCYVKPVAGSRGAGVIRVGKTENGFIFHKENQPSLSFSTWSAVLLRIKQETSGRKYILSPDVRLARVNQRAYDVRVMMQKDATGRWLCTGLCAKVAGPHSAVTNVARSHGRVISVDEALERSLGYSPTDIRKTIRELKALGFAACKQMERYQPYSEIGLDVGIDQSGRLWLLEVNTGPSHALFRHMSDPTYYHLIQRIWKERRQKHGDKSKFKTALA